MAKLATIYKNIYDKEPHYITIETALNRIKTGKSKNRIEEIRRTLDKEKADALKRLLPSVRFSGKFSSQSDDSLMDHSGFIILDFDNVNNVDEKAASMLEHDFVYAFWLSPRGNGLKVLVMIADTTKHREHFQALQEIFPDVDKSGVNESRVCYESYDPNLYVNPKAKPFNKLKTVEKIETREVVGDQKEIFTRLLTWLSNRNNTFVSGERNLFVFKLAGACCRYGLSEEAAKSLILSEYPSSNDFTKGECEKAIKSAYRSNKAKSGSASFDNEILVDKVTRKEIEIDDSIYDESIRPRDVIYGADVKGNAVGLYQKGHVSVQKLGIPIDKHFKMKRMELIGLSGIGNYGKSSFWKWYMLMRILTFGEKFASFCPEDNPPEEYFFDFVEMLLGCDCTPQNQYRPSIEVFNNAYDFISKYIFYLQPSGGASPTPEYVKERFLELIIKEKVDGCVIDPWNQMSHDYNKSGGARDKYLENVLGDLSRFAQMNSIYMTIIMHPNKMVKQADGNYPCPDLFDLNDGAMWNNKLDCLLMYHRPFMQTAPDDPMCEFHSKKIRRQKIVGEKGYMTFEYIRKSRRYEFSGVDYMAKLIKDKGLTFRNEQQVFNYKPKPYANLYLDSLAPDEDPL